MRFFNPKKNPINPDLTLPMWTIDRNKIIDGCLKTELSSFVEKNKAKDEVIRQNNTIRYIWDPERNDRLVEKYLTYFHNNIKGLHNSYRGVIYNTFYKLYITDIRKRASIYLSNEERILIEISVELIMKELSENGIF